MFLSPKVTAPATPLVLNGQVIAHANGHAWVNAALLHAGRGDFADKDVTNWITHNYDKAIAQAQEVYAGAARITPVGSVYSLWEGLCRRNLFSSCSSCSLILSSFVSLLL